jgi:hypothetical protein
LLLEKYEDEQQTTNQTTNKESDAETTHGISDAETTNEELDAGTEMTFEESLAECNLDDSSLDAIALKVYDTGEGLSGGDDSGNTANDDF